MPRFVEVLMDVRSRQPETFCKKCFLKTSLQCLHENTCAGVFVIKVLAEGLVN